MPWLFSHPLVLFILFVYGGLVVLGPIMLRLIFRFSAQVHPQPVPFDALPPDARAFMAPRVS